MILEVVICTLHSPPFVDYVFFIPNASNEIPYSLDIILTMFPLIRSYLLWRVFAEGSFWASERAERICKEECNTGGGPIFALKCEMKERPYTLILFTMLILIFICGFAMRAAEL
jgi:hypothetical protein